MSGIRSAIILDLPINYKFTSHGFNVFTMDCRAIPYAGNYSTDIEPILNITKKKGFSIEGRIMIDI